MRRAPSGGERFAPAGDAPVARVRYRDVQAPGPAPGAGAATAGGAEPGSGDLRSDADLAVEVEDRVGVGLVPRRLRLPLRGVLAVRRGPLDGLPLPVRLPPQRVRAVEQGVHDLRALQRAVPERAPVTLPEDPGQDVGMPLGPGLLGASGHPRELTKRVLGRGDTFVGRFRHQRQPPRPWLPGATPGAGPSGPQRPNDTTTPRRCASGARSGSCRTHGQPADAREPARRRARWRTDRGRGARPRGSAPSRFDWPAPNQRGGYDLLPAPLDRAPGPALHGRSVGDPDRLLGQLRPLHPLLRRYSGL